MPYQVRRREAPPNRNAELPYQEKHYKDSEDADDAVVVYGGDVLRTAEQPQYNAQYHSDDEYYDEYGRVDYENTENVNVNIYEEDDGYAYQEYADYTDISPKRGIDIKMAFLIGNIVIVAFMALFVVTQFLIPRSGDGGANQQSSNPVPPPQSGQTSAGSVFVPKTISPLFMPSVLYWEELITSWANVHNVDPNAIATIMQIESCGDPQAVSVAGAQGLFQVMPFHFESGENMLDPNTNAKRGVSYFAEGMRMTNGDPYLSFAGYNGGHGTAAKGWNNWPSETQRYYIWGKGIYDEVSTNQTYSDTLQQWLQNGGHSLCRQAETRLGI